MKPAPLLSIITPVLNCERHLPRCLASVAKYPHDNIEHIVVDGASSDSSPDILAVAASRDPRLRFVSERDRGQSDALNKGIRMSSGTWISILNADDYYCEDTLADISEILLRRPEGLVAGNCALVGPDEEILSVWRPKDFDWKRVLLSPYPAEYPINPCSYFYPRSFHDKHGYYDENDHYMMDLLFLLKVARHERYYYFDRLWGCMHWAPGTKTYDTFSSEEGVARSARNIKAQAAKLPTGAKFELWLERLKRLRR